MLENQIGKRYAEALSGSLTESAQLNPALDNLRSFCQAFETEKTLSHFFAHPAITAEKKRALVQDLCERFGVEKGVRSLVLLLVDRNKIPFLKNIAQYFEQVVDRRMNQARVHVISAYPLGDSETGKLKTELSRVLGKTVLLDTGVDESLIGGIQVQIGDQVADASIKNRLSILKRKIETEEEF